MVDTLGLSWHVFRKLPNRNLQKEFESFSEDPPTEGTRNRLMFEHSIQLAGKTSADFKTELTLYFFLVTFVMVRVVW